MKVTAAALLVLGASATRVKSFAKAQQGGELAECTPYCAEGYFYTAAYYDCEKKSDASDFYAPSPQCPKLCEDHGVECPATAKDGTTPTTGQSAASATSPAHEAANQIMAMFDQNGDGKIQKSEVDLTVKQYVQAEKEKYLGEQSAYIEQEAKNWEADLMKAYGEGFNMCDTDGDGKVTYDELVAALEAQGTGLAQIHAKNLGAKKGLRINFSKMAKFNKH
jgi:Ca2+-binding EF-hand superfamily protein